MEYSGSFLWIGLRIFVTLLGFSTNVWLLAIPFLLTDSTGLQTCNIYHKLGAEHRPEVLHRKETIQISSYIAFMNDIEETKWHLPVSGVTDWLTNL
jgi:hypothetical protein